MENNKIVHEQPLKEETIPLDPTKDRNIKWRCLGADCPDSCCIRFQQGIIFIQEILSLARYFPLTFNTANSPDGKKNITLSIFLRTSLEKAPCAYLQEGVGCNLGEQRPIVCKRFPFVMAKDQEGRDKVELKPSCPGFSGESGQPVLTAGGSINPLIFQECIKPAMSAAETAEETQKFVDALVEHDLIGVGCCEHREQKVYMHIIDAQKLRALQENVFDSFREKGYINLFWPI